MQDPERDPRPLPLLGPLLDRLARGTGRQVVALLVLFVAATILLLVTDFSPGRQLQEQAGMPLPDMLGGRLRQQLPTFLEALGASGRRLFAIYLVLDTGYAVLFGALFGTAIASAIARYEKIPQNLRLIALVPLTAAAFDIVENLGLLTLTLRYPTGPTPLHAVVSWFSAAKLALMNMTVLLGALALFGIAHHAMRAHEGEPERE